MNKVQLVGKVLPQLTRFTPGQLFVHKKFGYYGAILSSWTAPCYEHFNGLSVSSPSTYKDSSMPSHRLLDNRPQEHGASVPVRTTRMQRFYTVIVDKRDFGMIEPRLQSSVTYLNYVSDDDSAVVAVADSKMDYVEHEDVVPIELIEKAEEADKPFMSSILSESPSLFDVDRRKNAGGHSVHLVPTGYLSDFLASRPSSALRGQERRVEVTAGFKVSAMPFYLGKETGIGGQHVWRIWYRIECTDSCDLGAVPSATLRECHWHLVRGSRVSASEVNNPVFRPANKDATGLASIFQSPDHLSHIYQGTSIVRTESNSSSLWGWFRMEAKDGTEFNCFIPRFSLLPLAHRNTERTN